MGVNLCYRLECDLENDNGDNACGYQQLVVDCIYENMTEARFKSEAESMGWTVTRDGAYLCPYCSGNTE